MKRHDALLLIGPTASGKSPLGDLLQQRGFCGRRCVHFDFGAQLRRVAAGDALVASLSPADVDVVGSVLASGALLENDQFRIAEVILDEVVVQEQVDASDALVVLNGLPRHVGQADALARRLAVGTVVELKCSPDVVAERIRADPGGDRSGRVDDKPEEVVQKLVLYEKRTRPLVDHYCRAGAVVIQLDVNARSTPDEVYALLCNESDQMAAGG